MAHLLKLLCQLNTNTMTEAMFPKVRFRSLRNTRII